MTAISTKIDLNQGVERNFNYSKIWFKKQYQIY